MTMLKKKTRTLEEMPQDVKVLYAQIVAAQAMADKKVHPREFTDLYVFMAQIGLDAAAREQVRAFLINETSDIPKLADQLLKKVGRKDRDVVRFSIVKDLIRVARMDGAVAREELDNIRAVAVHLYQDHLQAHQVIELARSAIEYDERLLKNELTMDEFKQGAKDLAATATAIGVPVTAVYFSGSVIGLSAAGIISGLTELGFGGLLGFSSLVTGIGVVIIMGIITFKILSWLLTGQARKMKKMREHLMQEIVKLNQHAMAALAEDLNSLGLKMEQLALLSAENRRALEHLRGLYQNAFQMLKDREANMNVV